MYKDSNVEVQPEIDFVAHAAAMGAHAEKAADIADLEAKIVAARGRDIPTVIVIDTDAVPGDRRRRPLVGRRRARRSAAPSGSRKARAALATPTQHVSGVCRLRSHARQT